MGLKKTLASIVLVGAVALGIGSKAKADYFENFDSSPVGWVIDDNSKFYQTTFQNDGVMRFDIQESNLWKGASLPIDYHGQPFKLEWDSYSETTDSAVLRFGLFNNEFRWGNDNDIFFAYLLGEFMYNPPRWYPPQRRFLVCSKGWSQISDEQRFVAGTNYVSLNFFDKWLHNVLLYNFPYENSTVSGLITYNGKANTSDLELKLLFDGSALDLSFLNKLGFSSNPSGCSFGMGNEIGQGYIDNVNFQTIPEPLTLGLLALGGLAGILANRRKK